MVEENVEDQLEVQGKKDHEKLVTLGLERARRDEENRLKKVSSGAGTRACIAYCVIFTSPSFIALIPRDYVFALCYPHLRMHDLLMYVTILPPL